jgi:hypothetical protein
VTSTSGGDGKWGDYPGALSIPFTFATPVIVIDVPLLAVSFSPETHQLQIQQIQRGTIFWKQVVGGVSRLGVYIVTKEGLPSFLAECYASATWWTSIDEATLSRVFDEESRATRPVAL